MIINIEILIEIENGWKEKGIKLFEVKNYNEAMKYFRFSGYL